MSVPAVFDSIQQCASATGIPIRRLRMAKAAGCGAFRSNRIHLTEFLTWAFAPERAGESGIDWTQELAKAKTARENIRLEQDKKLVISRAEVGQRLRTQAMAQKEILSTSLADNPALVDRICVEMQSLVANWKA